MERDITWEWINSAVEMIPFGLLAGFYGEKEIRITKLAEEGFCFRVCAASEIPELREKLRLCFYDMKQNRYQEIAVTPDAWRVEKETEFFTSYAVAVHQEAYRIAVWTLFMQYDRYIRLKLEEDDSGLAEQMTGYPAEKDDVFADSVEEQMEAWFGSEAKGVRYKAGSCEQNDRMEPIETGPEESRTGEIGTNPESWQAEPEVALELDHPCVYTRFLKRELDEFLAEYQKQYPAFQDWLHNRKPDRIYIGNAFCHLLFPEQELLFALLEKAKKESLQVTLTFSYVREYQLEQTEELLKKLEQWCRKEKIKLEIEVNDWAMADMLKCGFPDLIPCYGRMLNKRRKDPRMAYKKGAIELLKQNPLNADFYRKYLEQEFGIHRFEWESCGYEQQFPAKTVGFSEKTVGFSEEMMGFLEKTMDFSEKTMDYAEKTALENHLHLPFYQTNTSQYCTLYAGSTYGDRSRQQLLTGCDRRCEWLAYLYPRHLDMVGRGNSLFGKDAEILEQTGIVPCDSEKTEEFCCRNHIDRLVLPGWLL